MCMSEIANKEHRAPDKAVQNIQDSFLNHARKERLLVTIFLIGGVRLTGKIKSFDKYALVLEANNQEQLIFKHAISTMVIQRVSHGGPNSPPPAEA